MTRGSGRSTIPTFALGRRRRYPGDRIAVNAPWSGRRKRLRPKEHRPLIAMVERAEQDDPVVRRLVETVAVLHADGVPRWLLRVPEHNETAGTIGDEEFWSMGFAGRAVDGVLDRLCDAGLLAADGEPVRMDPGVALAVRVRADQEGRAQDAAGPVGESLYAHATDLRLRTSVIPFPEPGVDSPDADALTARVRALLDQAVTLAWHTGYTCDKALDTILQAGVCLAELGHLADSRLLFEQMSRLCDRRLGTAHPISRDARESVANLRTLGRPGVDDSGSGSWRYQQAQRLYEQTVSVMRSGRLSDDVDLFRETVQAHRELVEHEDGYLEDLAVVLNNLGLVLQTGGQSADELVQVLQEELEVRRRLAVGGESDAVRHWGRVHSVLGVALAGMGKAEEGVPLAEEGVRIRRRVERDHPASMAHSLVDLAKVLALADRVGEVRETAAEAVECWRRLHRNGGVDAEDLPTVAEAHRLLGIAHHHDGSLEAAINELESAVGVFADAPLPPHPEPVFCLQTYALLLEHADRTAAAVRAQVDAIGAATELGLDDLAAECRAGLRRWYHDDPEQAGETWAAAIGGPPPGWLVDAPA